MAMKFYCGNTVVHDHLLAWQRSMKERADRVVF